MEIFFRYALPSHGDIFENSLAHNYTKIIKDLNQKQQETVLNGNSPFTLIISVTLMICSFIGAFVFFIVLYMLLNKFWRFARNHLYSIQRNIEIKPINNIINNDDSLPNYTLVSGLPSYDSAIENYSNLMKLKIKTENPVTISKPTTVTGVLSSYPSLFEVFQLDSSHQIDNNNNDNNNNNINDSNNIDNKNSNNIVHIIQQQEFSDKENCNRKNNKFHKPCKSIGTNTSPITTITFQNEVN